MAAPDLSPILQRQNSIQNDYAAKMAANTFSRNLSQTRGQRNLYDFRQSFERRLPSFQSGFGRRGLAGGGVSSGVYKGAMTRYLGDYTRDYGRLQEDIFNQGRQFDFDEARYTAERDNALADLQAQKAALIANTAQQIAALRPYMSGG